MTDIADLVARLRVEVQHDECEDCWYSCATLTCDDQRRSDKCDCGADERNAFNKRVIEALERLSACEKDAQRCLSALRALVSCIKRDRGSGGILLPTDAALLTADEVIADMQKAKEAQ